MGSFLRFAAVTVVTVALFGCETEQPTQGGSAAATLTLDTVETIVLDADVWEIWEDISIPRDGIPDRPRRATQPNGPILHRCDTASTPGRLTRYPWGFSVEVSVLRGGTTRPEVLSSTFDQTSRYTGVTRFVEQDTPVPIDDATAAPPNHFRNGRRISFANPDYATLCRLETFTANIGSLGNPATITLNPGDTLIVQARKALESGNPVLGGIFPIPILEGTLLIGGRPVTTQGISQSTGEDGDGISFSYTLN